MTKTYNILATTILTLAMMIAVGMLTSCKIEIVKNDDKNDETKVFNVKEFSRIEASVGASIIYSVSDTTEVKVVSSRRQIDRLDIETKDGVLYIGFKNENPNGGRIVINNRSKGIKIFIRGPKMEGVALSGSGEFKTKDHITAEFFNARISGSGWIDIDGIKAKTLKADISGSGDMDLGCIEATETSLSVAGSGKIEAEEVNVDMTNIQIAGSGDIDVDMNDCGTAIVNIAGSGDVKLKGTVNELNKSVAGSGNINTKDLVIKGGSN